MKMETEWLLLAQRARQLDFPVDKLERCLSVWNLPLQEWPKGLREEISEMMVWSGNRLTWGELKRQYVLLFLEIIDSN